ncbi:hypothetical protein GCM10014715_02380 [Streptomyces spiralis]|uniref:Uncharacterized protein n=1 Tax=Streptomyces spiralis TaxID=66376 RepID=A0A919DKC6_9ACTN|nr:hypothetical protein GCM10014715_02380 [Streptomyces spiralis]
MGVTVRDMCRIARTVQTGGEPGSALFSLGPPGQRARGGPFGGRPGDVRQVNNSGVLPVKRGMPGEKHSGTGARDVAVPLSRGFRDPLGRSRRTSVPIPADTYAPAAGFSSPDGLNFC